MRLTVGRQAELLTAPPLSADTFDVAALADRKIVYFKLHGLPEQPFWYDARWATALTAEQIARSELGGAIVVVANCFALGGPMEEALLLAGAAAVLGDADEAYGRRRSLGETDLLCQLLIDQLRLGWAVGDALERAGMAYRVRRRAAGGMTSEDEATLRDFGVVGNIEARVGRL